MIATSKQATPMASSLHFLSMYQMKYSLIDIEQSFRHKIKITIRHEDRVAEEFKQIPRLASDEGSAKKMLALSKSSCIGNVS